MKLKITRPEELEHEFVILLFFGSSFLFSIVLMSLISGENNSFGPSIIYGITSIFLGCLAFDGKSVISGEPYRIKEEK